MYLINDRAAALYHSLPPVRPRQFENGGMTIATPAHGTAQSHYSDYGILLSEAIVDL